VTSREIGERIKTRRKELGLSQEQLAEALNVTYQQVQRYENGRNKLNVENVQVIAEKLGVTLFYFFGDKTPDSSASETSTPYKIAPEENQLLKYFRRITDNVSRNTVVRVARLAAKTK